MLKQLKLRQKYNNSIAFRYLSIAGICLVVLQLIFGVTFSYLIYQQKLKSLEEKAQAKLQLLSAIAPDMMLRSDTIGLKNLLQTSNNDREIIYSLITDKNSQIITQSIAVDKPIVSNLKITTNLPKNFSQEVKLISALKKHNSILEASQTISLGDTNLGTIKLGYSLKTARQELIRVSLYNLYSVILISSLFIGLTKIIFQRQIINPIHKLQQLAQAIAAGKLDARVVVERDDELGKLSVALNSMMLQIQHSLKNLEKAIDNALIAEKAKNKFMAKMSHELRTPLNGIIGFTQIMQQEPTTTVEQQETLDIIEQNSLHLLNLINDVLEITHIEAGETAIKQNSFDLYNLLQSLKQMFTFKAQAKNIELSFKIVSGVPQYIESDEDKLRQILSNLLDNSIKFTETGKVSLIVKSQSNTQTDFVRNLYFKITDTGKGISSTEIDRLFVAFAQTETGETPNQGIGLGLPITRQLIQLMGGDISLKSKVNQGTVVRFYLPVAEADVSKISFQKYCATDSQSLEGDSIDSKFFCQPDSSYQLAAEKLATMPQKWLLQLQDATTKIDNELMLELLAEVAEENQILSQAIINLIDNFRYDDLLKLIEKTLNQK